MPSWVMNTVISCIGETVTSGVVDLTIKWGFIPLPIKPTLDLCTLVPCPLQAGDGEFSVAKEIPDSLPGVSIIYMQITQLVKINV